MRLDAADDAFSQDAAAWLRSLPDDTIKDIAAVFRASPGYYPTTLAPLWRDELNGRGLADCTVAAAAAERLPVCHPGDCEWRFTDEAAVALADHASAGLPRDARVAHVGTPKTFMAGRARWPLLEHALLERSATVVRSLGDLKRVYQIDLMKDKPPPLGARAAIVDPPWYPADTRAFLSATNAACAFGARIVLCQPTLATRPGVAEERAALLDQLPQLGYSYQRCDSVCIRYRMPHFEAMSLRAAVPDLRVPDDWRVGDTLTLQKTGESRYRPETASSADSWDEVHFGPVRIKLRRTREPDLGPIVPGDVLDNVSRRDPVRGQIGLWTSGNRVFTLNDPATLGRVITRCHDDALQSKFTFDRTLAHAAEAGLDKNIARRLFDLLLIELQEHALRGEQ